MANKKINQLVSKTSILSTDIFGIGDATTGQLYKKTIAELQAAIGGAVISVNGLVGTVVLNTDNIQESGTPTNKYFTDTRARSAISLTVTGSSGASTYSSGTGVLNVPTYTLAGLGGITAGFLSGTSGISYNSTTGVITYNGTVYTDASVRALVSASTGLSYNSATGVFTNTITQYTDALARLALSAGTGISYSNTTGVITSTITQYTDTLARASISAGTGISYSSGTGIIASTITQYTDALAKASISLTTTGSSGSSTYNSTTGVLNIPTYTLSGLGGITASFLSGGTGITYNSTTGAISYSGTVYTNASILSLLSGGTGITYNSATGAISYSGTVYTDSSVRALISITTTGTSGASTYNNTTGVINVPNYTLTGLGGITLGSLSGGTGISYNSSTGAISYSGTVYTDASVRALLSAGTGISYSNTTGLITSTITQYTDALARASISITTTGTSGASTYNSTTGVLNVPQYQGAISLTTTGSSGVATFSANTLNIPNYGSALSGYLPLTGGTLTGALGGTSATFSGLGTFNGNLLTSGNIASAAVSSYIDNNNATGFSVLGLRNNGASGSEYQIVVGGNTSASPNNFYIYDATRAAVRLTIASTGAATFSSSVTAVSNISITAPSTSIAPQMVLNQTGGNTYGAMGINRSDGSGVAVGLANALIIRSGDSSDFPIQFATANNVRMTITSAGNILIGTTTDNGEKLYVSGAIRATGNITANSDLTLKKNLLRIENALEKVEQINGYTYEFKDNDSKRHAGVIAQEIQTVLPEIVNKGNDGILGVEYGNISALLIEAIKEQNIKIKNLETLLASK